MPINLEDWFTPKGLFLMALFAAIAHTPYAVPILLAAAAIGALLERYSSDPKKR